MKDLLHCTLYLDICSYTKLPSYHPSDKISLPSYTRLRTHPFVVHVGPLFVDQDPWPSMSTTNSLVKKKKKKKGQVPSSVDILTSFLLLFLTVSDVPVYREVFRTLPQLSVPSSKTSLGVYKRRLKTSQHTRLKEL